MSQRSFKSIKWYQKKTRYVKNFWPCSLATVCQCNILSETLSNLKLIILFFSCSNDSVVVVCVRFVVRLLIWVHSLVLFKSRCCSKTLCAPLRRRVPNWPLGAKRFKADAILLKTGLKKGLDAAVSGGGVVTQKWNWAARPARNVQEQPARRTTIESSLIL